jgi:hypothetical protein
MPTWLLVVLKAHSHRAVYSVFLDVLERRLSAPRPPYGIDRPVRVAETVGDSPGIYHCTTMGCWRCPTPSSGKKRQSEVVV